MTAVGPGALGDVVVVDVVDVAGAAEVVVAAVGVVVVEAEGVGCDDVDVDVIPVRDRVPLVVTVARGARIEAK